MKKIFKLKTILTKNKYDGFLFNKLKRISIYFIRQQLILAGIKYKRATDFAYSFFFFTNLKENEENNSLSAF